MYTFKEPSEYLVGTISDLKNPREIHANLPREDYNKLARLAIRHNLTMSAVVRSAISVYLKHPKVKELLAH